MPSISIWRSAQGSPSGGPIRQMSFLMRGQQPPPGDSVVINMNNVEALQNPSPQPATPTAVDKSKNETLFGPPIGVGSANNIPNWAKGTQDPSDAGSAIPPEVIKEWIAKRKHEPSKPSATTTLQALVNLKRPSIRLTPLSNSSESSASPSTSHVPAHGLEFDFDCDAARCRIIVSAFPPDTAAVNKEATPSKPVVLFDHAFDGGFGRTLRFEDGAVLELAKLEAELKHGESSEIKPSLGVNANPSQEALGGSAAAHGHSLDAAGSSSRLSVPANQLPGRKRLSAFGFRRKHDRQAAGPALQVVDAEVEAAIQAARRASAEDHDFDDLALNTNNGEGPSKSNETEADEGGVRITIRLEALDESDAPLPNRNVQTTYLHVLRMGAVPENTEEDHRAWVVKVVKREACIGQHTFRLQEIYGLASSSSQSQPSASASPSYPPSATVPNSSWDTPSTECVLCLSSPREVVLLPCRHLVACRECAVNMVEFGAGGQLTHEIEASAAAAEATQADGDAATAANNTTPAANGAPATPVAPTPRRKRKAKGWFCPVCRQPYTSLLRISPHPPGKVLDDSSTLRSQERAPMSSSPEPMPESPAAQEVTLPAVPAPAATRGSGTSGLTSVLANLRIGGSKPQQRSPADDLEVGINQASNVDARTVASA